MKKVLTFSPLTTGPSPLILLLLLSCLILNSGCNMTSSQRIAALQAVVDTYQTQSEVLDIEIASLRNSIDDLKEQIEADPAADPEDKAKLQEFIDKRMAELDRVMAEKRKYDERIAAWKVKIDEIAAQEVNVGDEIVLLGEGIKSVSLSLPPPINLYGLGIGTLLTAIGGGLANRYRKKLKSERAVTADIVGSVEKVLRTVEGDATARTREDLEDILARRMGDAAKTRVRTIKQQTGL